MRSGMHFRRNGWFLTEELFRHASVLRSCKYPELPQIFHSLSCVLILPGLQVHPVRSLCRLSTSALYALLPPHMWHGSYVLPAIKILWNAGTVLLSSPNAEQNTTDSILLADHGKTVPSCSTHRRTVSQMSGGYRIFPVTVLFLHESPMQLPVQILQYDPFLSEEDFPGS